MDVLSDYQEHSAGQIRDEIQKQGIEIDTKNSAFRMAMYQLRNSGIRIESKEKGMYCLIKEEELVILQGFVVLQPVERFSKKCVYIHDDGKLVLNGKLNAEITSRNIEIRIAENGERLALIVNGSNPHKFTKSGQTSNKELLKILQRKKIKFPVSYEMIEEEKNCIWIGNLMRSESLNK